MRELLFIMPFRSPRGQQPLGLFNEVTGLVSTCLTVIFCLISFFTDAQNFSRDMAMVNTAYLNLNRDMNIHTVTKSSTGETTAQKVHVKMKNIDHYYISNDETEVLITGAARLLVNKAERVILLDSNYSDAGTSFPVQLFDTIMHLYDSIERVEKAGGKTAYILFPKVGMLDKIQITFQNETHLITDIFLDGVDPNSRKRFTMNVSYSYSNLSPIPTLSKYLKRNTEGHYALNSAWQGYEFYDYLTLRN